jgi:hypothetical protein
MEAPWDEAETISGGVRAPQKTGSFKRPKIDGAGKSRPAFCNQARNLGCVKFRDAIPRPNWENALATAIESNFTCIVLGSN